MVYFLQCKTTGLVKIGTTVRLTDRLGALRSQTKTDLQVIGVVDGGRSVEAELHRQFAEFRSHGEWFFASREVMDFVATEAEHWDGRDEAPITTVRIESDLARMLDQVSILRGVTISDYIRSDLAQLIHEHLVAEAEKILAAGA